jgi:hypothetical protein
MATRPKFQSAIFAIFLASALPNFTAPIEDQLVTRSYKLDIEKIRRLQETTLAELAPAPKSSPANLLQAVFAEAGITFPDNLMNAVPLADKNQKAFYLNERTGELRLCATRRDIPKFERWLQRLSPDPPQEIETAPRVEFETVFVEIPLPSPPLLTLEPRPLGANFASLIAFTNIAVLAPKSFQTNFQNNGTSTAIQFPTATVIKFRRLRLPPGSVDLSDRPTIPIASPSIPTETLIIRSESDVGN